MLIALVILYFSVDVLLNTQEYLSQIKLSSYIKFPRYVMISFLVISILMIAEFTLERFAAYQSKSEVAKLRSEITDLKAKLQGQSNEVIPTESEEGA